MKVVGPTIAKPPGGTDVMTYWVIGLPPLLAGAPQFTWALLMPGVAVTF
jgi:hypothetical protein